MIALIVVLLRTLYGLRGPIQGGHIEGVHSED